MWLVLTPPKAQLHENKQTNKQVMTTPATETVPRSPPSSGPVAPGWLVYALDPDAGALIEGFLVPQPVSARGVLLALVATVASQPQRAWQRRRVSTAAVAPRALPIEDPRAADARLADCLSCEDGLLHLLARLDVRDADAALATPAGRINLAARLHWWWRRCPAVALYVAVRALLATTGSCPTHECRRRIGRTAALRHLREALDGGASSFADPWAYDPRWDAIPFVACDRARLPAVLRAST